MLSRPYFYYFRRIVSLTLKTVKVLISFPFARGRILALGLKLFWKLAGSRVRIWAQVSLLPKHVFWTKASDCSEQRHQCSFEKCKFGQPNQVFDIGVQGWPDDREEKSVFYELKTSINKLGNTHWRIHSFSGKWWIIRRLVKYNYNLWPSTFGS